MNCLASCLHIAGTVITHLMSSYNELSDYKDLFRKFLFFLVNRGGPGENVRYFLFSILREDLKSITHMSKLCSCRVSQLLDRVISKISEGDGEYLHGTQTLSICRPDHRAPAQSLGMIL